LGTFFSVIPNFSALRQEANLAFRCVVFILSALLCSVQHYLHSPRFLHKLSVLSCELCRSIRNEPLGDYDIIGEFD
jgi:hypothetical protein